MKRKILVLALVAIGLVVAATSAALNLFAWSGLTSLKQTATAGASASEYL